MSSEGASTGNSFISLISLSSSIFLRLSATKAVSSGLLYNGG
ncbi:hypothetical protein [Heyndrickxia oleronia]|nr:hypothetical protein [Heyndrickxia oleronia]